MSRRRATRVHRHASKYVCVHRSDLCMLSHPDLCARADLCRSSATHLPSAAAIVRIRHTERAQGARCATPRTSVRTAQWNCRVDAQRTQKRRTSRFLLRAMRACNASLTNCEFALRTCCKRVAAPLRFDFPRREFTEIGQVIPATGGTALRSSRRRRWSALVAWKFDGGNNFSEYCGTIGV